MTYIEYHFTIQPTQPATDILLAELGEAGFESFVEIPSGLLAYIAKADWHSGILNNLNIVNHPEVTITWFSKEIAPQNWNAVWEKNFPAVTIGEKCRVRAPFHPKKKVLYDIVIEPKMSFGTGHHETTYLMLQHLLDTDCVGKAVLDMGCGTGILAILAKKKEAARVEAIDIDEWCFINTQGNVKRNGCEDIQVLQGDSNLLAGKTYDIILANINRNILLADIPLYATCLTPEGSLFLSGFYKKDLEAISSKCKAQGLVLEKIVEKNFWIAAKYIKGISNSFFF